MHYGLPKISEIASIYGSKALKVILTSYNKSKVWLTSTEALIFIALLAFYLLILADSCAISIAFSIGD